MSGCTVQHCIVQFFTGIARCNSQLAQLKEKMKQCNKNIWAKTYQADCETRKNRTHLLLTLFSRWFLAFLLDHYPSGLTCGESCSCRIFCSLKSNLLNEDVTVRLCTCLEFASSAPCRQITKNQVSLLLSKRVYCVASFLWFVHFFYVWGIFFNSFADCSVQVS